MVFRCLKTSLNGCFLSTESAEIVGFVVERIGESGGWAGYVGLFYLPRRRGGAEVVVVQGCLYLFSAALLGLSGRMMEQSKPTHPTGDG